MKIVIDIPSEMRKLIMDGVYCGISDKRLYEAIRNGMSLPAEYGRLIDGDRLFDDLVDGYESINWDEVDARDIIEEIEGAPTIIEPYKAESEVRPC